MELRLLVHSARDNVGVITSSVSTGEIISGAYLDDSNKIQIKTIGDISLGHKIALRDIRKDEKIVEYGAVIGIAYHDIRKGEMVHTHNIKSLRW